MSSKEKTIRIIVDVILIAVGVVFLIFGIKDTIEMYESSVTPDNVLFKRSYTNVRDDNPYKYLSEKEYESILENGSGIIFIGNPNDAWSQVLVGPLTDIIDSYEVSNVYYFEMEEDTPRILIIDEGEKLVELSKSDIFDEGYDGIPIEYFEQEENRTTLEKSLEAIEKLK